KLSTLRSPLWSAIAVAVLSLGLAAMQASTVYGPGPLEPEKAAMGVAVFGVPVLMILSSLTVTNEYRSGLIRTTFMAVPNRTLVLVAKAVVAAVFSGAYAAVMVAASIAVARSDPHEWGLVGAIALYAMIASVLGVGVGALMRASAGAVALLLLWPLVVEPILANLPNVGTQVGPYLPFANAFIFIRVQWLYPVYAMPWGPGASIVYFAAVTAVVFAAALVVINRRDA
ncbi:MAG TPA: ABC transporter permease, partial [Mycobacterium sp.]|nr:ABC transporter permease [Mycobacterium sp.]